MIGVGPAGGVRFAASERGPPGRGSPRPGSELDPAVLARPVLIVEDEAMIAWALESLLAEIGFAQVAIAASAAAAAAQARRAAPGLILSDINLGHGEVDGITAAAMIAGAGVGVVFITAFAGAEARARIARELPGAALVRKPVAEGDLRRAIAAVAAGNGAQ
ncbi:MAG: hypothetical protein NVSMB18_23500 [Acetobacteraceae bacterium]